MSGTQRSVVVAQSGGATAVINASLVGVVDEAIASGHYGSILGAKNGIEGVLNGNWIELGELDPGQRQRLRDTPSSALGTGRYKLRDEEVDRCLDILVGMNAAVFVLIGGNDSADTVHRLHVRAGERGIDLQAVAVPKTVDNDLPVTDHCPGYASMARALGNVVRDATWDTLAAPGLYPVKVIEVMGRDAGWVAAAGAVGFGSAEAGLAPIILTPERPPASADEIVAMVSDDLSDRGWSLVVVPETLRTAAGRHLGGDEPEYVDPHGHPYFPSAGAALARGILERLGVRARAEKPGSFLRMSASMASEVDRDEAHALGVAAVAAATRGEAGGRIPVLMRAPGATYRCEIELAPVEAIANRVRRLPDEFLPRNQRGATEAFRSWVMPMLGPDPFPDYLRLDGHGKSVTN